MTRLNYDHKTFLRSMYPDLWRYASNGNRRAANGTPRDHADFSAQLAAISEPGYQGPIILECTAPGPDPFTAIKEKDSVDRLETY